jgi:class 3 adenylate cyclase
MRLVEHLFATVSPSFLIPRREWLSLWRQSELQSFKIPGRVLCLGFAALYFSHYFLIDVPVGKQPIEWYRWYRFSVAAVGLAAFFVTFTKWFRESKLYKLPALVCVAYTVYMQGQSMIVRPQVPFFYVPLFAMFGAYALRLSILGTLAAFGAVLLLSHEAFGCRPSESYHMVSGSVVGAVILVILRSRLTKDVEAFLLTRQNEEAQKKLIASQVALTDQLRSFLPREHFRRVEDLMLRQRKTPLQAVDEVLRPRKALAALCYSDIRGFTQLSKKGDETVLSLILPAQKAATSTMDQFGGISRLQGDLIFSYFDSDNPIENISAALRASVQMQLETSLLNGRDRSHTLRRYSIVTFGNVIVGNMGGTESSRDVTALGDPANLSARLDAITKEPILSEVLSSCPLVASTEALNVVRLLFPQLLIKSVDLRELDLSIRDFPEETKLHLIPITEQNRAILDSPPVLSEAIKYLQLQYPEVAVGVDKQGTNPNRNAA